MPETGLVDRPDPDRDCDESKFSSQDFTDKLPQVFEEN
jgi:hypothetical protein